MSNTLNELKEKLAFLEESTALLTNHKNYDLIKQAITLGKSFISTATEAAETGYFDRAETCLKDTEECIRLVFDFCHSHN